MIARSPVSFALLNDGARWVGTNASVDVRVLPVVGEPAYASRPEEHATGYGQWALHDTLTVDVDATADAGFLSIILPVAHDESAPVATMEKTREGLVTADIEWDDVRYRVAYDRADGVSIWADDVLVGDYP